MSFATVFARSLAGGWGGGLWVVVGRGDDGRRWRAAALALALDSREIILIIFTVEIFCKVVAEDGEPLNFLYTGALNSWNCFDLFVVLGSYGSNVRCNWGKAQTKPRFAPLLSHEPRLGNL